jgi:transposase
MQWSRAYRERGLAALVDHRRGGNRAKLKPEQIEALQSQLHQYPPAQLLGRHNCVGEGQFWSVAELAQLLQRDYGVLYQSQTSYRTLLGKCELSYQRPAKQYKSRSEAKLMDFEEQFEKKTG